MTWRTVVLLTVGLVLLLVLLVIGSPALYLILVGLTCIVAAARGELLRPRRLLTAEQARHDYRHARRLDHARHRGTARRRVRTR